MFNGEEGIKYDTDKLRYDLIDPLFEEELAKVATFGCRKYGELNWQKVDNGKKRYFNALRRHLKEYEKGNMLDDETGFLHLSHAAWNIMALIWFGREENGE